jgi:hypothetical protein
VRFRKPTGYGRGPWLALVVLFCAATAGGQGPAPETAPPLFPGGGLISYNSIFTTRGLTQGMSGSITPLTARPTFSHEGDFNFTWGFYHDFDVTILIPVVTNHFDVADMPTVGGTGLGDAMVLAKYRFYRRDSPRGTTQVSVTFGPKLPTGLIWTMEMASDCLQVCSLARALRICFWPLTRPTPGFSTSGAW